MYVKQPAPSSSPKGRDGDGYEILDKQNHHFEYGSMRIWKHEDEEVTKYLCLCLKC